MMSWIVYEHPRFAEERKELGTDISDALDAVILVIETSGPHLKRPLVDTLNGSRHANMKEIRIKVERVHWRFAFAFDPDRDAVILCGGQKSGVSQRRFYKSFISRADARFDEWLEADD